MKFNLNDLATVKLSKKGMLIYYKKALESKENYLKHLKEWNNWDDLSQAKAEEIANIENYLQKRSQQYFQQITCRLQKKGTLTIPLDEMIEIFGPELARDSRMRLFKESSVIIDINSGTRKLFPPEEKPEFESISLRDQLLLELTEFGVFLLRKNGYQGPIYETKEALISIFDMMRFMNHNIKQYGSDYDILASQKVSWETKQCQPSSLIRNKKKVV